MNKCEVVNDFGELGQIVEKARRAWDLRADQEIWFRGEAKDYGDSALVPTVYRGPDGKVSNRSAADLLELESHLYDEFCRCAPQLAAEVKEGNYWEWDAYFLMQHHGCPTRLLDWTDGALLAALMALGDRMQKKSDDAVIWMLEPDRLSKHLRSLPDRLQLQFEWRQHYRHSRQDGLVDGDDIDAWEQRYLPIAKDELFSVKLPGSPFMIDTQHIAARVAAQRSRLILFGTERRFLRNCSPGGMLTLRWPPVQPPAIPSEAFPILLDTVMGASILTVG